jgi:hypothetical protein
VPLLRTADSWRKIPSLHSLTACQKILSKWKHLITTVCTFTTHSESLRDYTETAVPSLAGGRVEVTGKVNKGQAALFIFLALIISWYAFYKWNKRSLESNPAIELALSSAQKDAQPLIDAIEKYHTEHGFYPRSIKDLPYSALWGKYLYQTSSLNSVYKSLDCQRRVRDLMGWQTAEKRQKMQETQEECLLGYSQFLIKSQVQASHLNMYVFVVFDSTNPKWNVDWCTPNDNRRDYCGAELAKLREENRQ